jgi:uncharacterized protein (DUF1786 family)
MLDNIYGKFEKMKQPDKKTKDLKIRIVSIDVGAWTQDILLYNDSYESAFKLILPSPTLILANKVRKSTNEGKHIVVTGEIMGGGPFNHALYNHISSGFDVYMTENAARTVRDDLDIVKEKGIKVTWEKEASELMENGMEHIETKDIDKAALESSLRNFGFDFHPEIVAVGVEDHGVAPKGESDRVRRFHHFNNFIPAGISDFGFSEPPSFYSRMMGVKRTLNAEFPDSKYLIMDSKIAAMFGGLFGSGKKNAVTMDVGNGHITVASIEDEKITGLFEHHTGMLTREKIEILVRKFSQGDLTNKEVYDDGGHGCCIAKPIGDADIIATGPKRNILLGSELEIEFVNPYGDTMISGNVGLTECAKKKYIG